MTEKEFKEMNKKAVEDCIKHSTTLVEICKKTNLDYEAPAKRLAELRELLEVLNKELEMEV